MDTRIPILFTLKSNKFYIGYPVRLPNPTQNRRYVRVLPIASGYRNIFHQLEFTTDYYEILNMVANNNRNLEHLTVEDFEVVFPVDQVTSAHHHDLVAYNHFVEQGNSLPLIYTQSFSTCWQYAHRN